MRGLKYTLIILFSLVLVVVITAAVGVPWAVRSFHEPIEQKLKDGVKAACASCVLTAESIEWSWFSGLKLSDLHLRAGHPGGQQVEATAVSVLLWPALWPLLHRELRLRRILIQAPDVTFIDGEKVVHSSPGEAAADEDLLHSFSIERLRIVDGQFTYVRNLKGTHAVFKMHQIDIVVDAFGTTDELKQEPAQAHATVQIGNSGGAELDVSARLFEKPLQIDTELQVHGQSLAALSTFFKPNAGVELQGELVKGHWQTKLRGRHLTASVLAEYKDFSLHLDPMYDRSEVVAFFTNLGAAIVLREKNVKKTAAEQTKTVEIEREPKESIVSFILRGIKIAAIDIAEGDTAALKRAPRK